MAGPLLTRAQSRRLDKLASDQYGIASLVLMENAGRGVVDMLAGLGIGGRVDILCGKGNNAGDGFVIARHLAIRTYECQVLLINPAEKLSGDARTNYEILTRCDVPIVDLSSQASDPQQLTATLDEQTVGGGWLVDALLGTGIEGEPRPPLDTVIDWINGKNVPTLAVDVPSGLDCDTGTAAQHTVRAEHTCTFVAVKHGYAAAGAEAYTGQVHVLDIGTPPRLLQEVLAE